MPAIPSSDRQPNSLVTFEHPSPSSRASHPSRLTPHRLAAPTSPHLLIPTASPALHPTAPPPPTAPPTPSLARAAFARNPRLGLHAPLRGAYFLLTHSNSYLFYISFVVAILTLTLATYIPHPRAPLHTSVPFPPPSLARAPPSYTTLG